MPTNKQTNRRRAIAAASTISTAPPVSTVDELISAVELAEMLGVSKQWVEGARRRGTGPAFIMLSPHCIRYKKTDVQAWLNSQVREAS